MSNAGGAREGAGRKPGSRGRRTLHLVDAMAEGILPLDYMLKILRDETAEPEARQWAAEKAAGFVHAKPAPAQRLVTIDLPATDTPAGVKDALARLIEAVAGGEISPAEAMSVAALIEGQRKAIETADLQERVEALEAANGTRRPSAVAR